MLTKTILSLPWHQLSVVPPAGAKTYTLPQPSKIVSSSSQFFGRRICVSFAQSLKAPAPMAVQESGIYTMLIAPPSKALSSMVLIAPGSAKSGSP